MERAFKATPLAVGAEVVNSARVNKKYLRVFVRVLRDRQGLMELN